MGGIAWSLEGEDEVVRSLIGPAAEALGLLRTVKGAVDLDRGDSAARISKLFRLPQALGIEHASPGFINPAPNADPDRCAHPKPR